MWSAEIYERVEDLQLVVNRAYDCTEGGHIELLSLGVDSRHCIT